MVQLCRLFTILIFVSVIVFCDSKRTKDRNDENILTLFDLFGLKVKHDNTFKVPVIIIMAILNRRETVNIKKIITGETPNDKNINKSIQHVTLKMNMTEVFNETFDIQVKPAVKRDIQTTSVPQNGKDIFKENYTVENKNATDAPLTTTKEDEIVETTEMSRNTTTINTFAKPNSPYPNPQYNNEVADSIFFTTEIPKLPAVNDSRWQNFSSIKSTSKSQPTKSSEKTKHNKDVEQNPNLIANNQTAPEKGWSKFYISDPVIHSSEFKPLSGLYYDGFLHKPLKKHDFIPHRYYNSEN
ncbi:hypothetical protein evm_010800 [Chilo suppressalis]|nr:hypothetical protein evm_010800 [Chilo suppressalis]